MRLIDADKVDFNEVIVGASDFARDTRAAAQSLIDGQPEISRWIPVEERLPEREEWIGIKGKEHYLRRMEIAVDSDTIEYFLVFYDGYKWFDKFGRTYAGIKAWKIHEPFIPPKCPFSGGRKPWD